MKVDYMKLTIDYGLDIWGNPYDGFDCNNVHYRKEIEITNKNITDTDLVQLLADDGVLSDIAVKMFTDGDLVIENDTIYERIDLDDYDDINITKTEDVWPFMPIAFLNWY